MSDCLFCQIIRGQVPSDKVYEDESTLVFRDIHPVAPVHVLVVPKTHYDQVLTLMESPKGAEDLTAIFQAVAAAAKKLGVNQTGFRLIHNCGDDGGQTVGHAHFHLIGGRALGEGLV